MLKKSIFIMKETQLFGFYTTQFLFNKKKTLMQLPNFSKVITIFYIHHHPLRPLNKILFVEEIFFFVLYVKHDS